MIMTHPVSVLAFFAFMLLNISFSVFPEPRSKLNSCGPLHGCLLTSWRFGGTISSALLSGRSSRNVLGKLNFTSTSTGVWKSPVCLRFLTLLKIFSLFFFWVPTTYLILRGWVGQELEVKFELSDVGKTSCPCVCDSGKYFIPMPCLPLWVSWEAHRKCI